MKEIDQNPASAEVLPTLELATWDRKRTTEELLSFIAVREARLTGVDL